MLAYRAYLIREKICERKVAVTSSVRSSPASTAVSYWDRAKSIFEMAMSHTGQYKLHEQLQAESQRHAADRSLLYSNAKNIKAICKQGKATQCLGFMSTERENSRSSFMCKRSLWALMTENDVLKAAKWKNLNVTTFRAEAKIKSGVQAASLLGK